MTGMQQGAVASACSRPRLHPGAGGRRLWAQTARCPLSSWGRMRAGLEPTLSPGAAWAAEVLLGPGGGARKRAAPAQGAPHPPAARQTGAGCRAADGRRGAARGRGRRGVPGRARGGAGRPHHLQLPDGRGPHDHRHGHRLPHAHVHDRRAARPHARFHDRRGVLLARTGGRPARARASGGAGGRRARPPAGCPQRKEGLPWGPVLARRRAATLRSPRPNWHSPLTGVMQRRLLFAGAARLRVAWRDTALRLTMYSGALCPGACAKAQVGARGGARRRGRARARRRHRPRGAGGQPGGRAGGAVAAQRRVRRRARPIAAPVC